MRPRDQHWRDGKQPPDGVLASKTVVIKFAAALGVVDFVNSAELQPDWAFQDGLATSEKYTAALPGFYSAKCQLFKTETPIDLILSSRY